MLTTLYARKSHTTQSFLDHHHLPPPTTRTLTPFLRSLFTPRILATHSHIPARAYPYAWRFRNNCATCYHALAKLVLKLWFSLLDDAMFSNVLFLVLLLTWFLVGLWFVDRVAMGWIAILHSRTEAKLLQEKNKAQANNLSKQATKKRSFSWRLTARLQCVLSSAGLRYPVPSPSFSVTNLSLMTTKTISTVTIFEFLNEFIIWSWPLGTTQHFPRIWLYPHSFVVLRLLNINFSLNRFSFLFCYALPT